MSVRTVYHHFPNREAQIEAVSDWIEHRVGRVDALPTKADQLPEFCEKMHRRFLDNEALMRAQLAEGVARHVRARRRRRIASAIDAYAVETGATSEDARLAGALLRYAVSADATVALVDNHGLDRDDAVRVPRWAVGAVVQALKRGDGPTSSSTSKSKETR